MYDVKVTPASQDRDGHIDLSYEMLDDWDDFVTMPHHVGLEPGSMFRVLLFGDADVGPSMLLTCTPPQTDPLPRAPAHRHDSDNWRISLRGTTSMGRATYAAGEFRFQRGGEYYGGDDITWGPDGGYGLVFFADRRGMAVRPAKPSSFSDDASRVWAEACGLTVPDPYPGASSFSSQLGVFDKSGKLEGAFHDSAAWPELVPGVRMVISLLGDATAGPVVLLVDADAGVSAVPAGTFPSEVLHLMVAGSAQVGDDVLKLGAIRLQTAAVPSPAITAGPDGLQQIMIIGDRRHLPELTVDATDAPARDWAQRLVAHVERLTSELATVPAPARAGAPESVST